VNLADTLRGLLRRWYIVVPGIVVAIAVAIGAWTVIKPDYERTATQLLLPGTTSIPEAGNPYLFLGGLSQAADVLVTAMSADNELDPILADHPGAKIEVTRDPATSGPMVLTTVTAGSDQEAGEMIHAAVSQTEDALGNLQDVDGITTDNRIGIKTITIDQQSTLQQKNRLLSVAVAAIVVLLLTFVVASLVDGLSTRRRRAAASSSPDDDEDAVETAVEEETADLDDATDPLGTEIFEQPAALPDETEASGEEELVDTARARSSASRRMR